MVILGAVSSAGEYSRHGRGAVPLHGHRRRRGLRRPFIIDPILTAVTTYSEYTATASAAAMLDPDTHQTAQPEFGAAIALMVF